MHSKIVILFVLGVLFTSCGDDLPTFDNTLQLDGQNANAPVFNAGTYENASYFSAEITKDKVGRELRSIDFYVYEIPNSLEVIVYGDATTAQPGVELYRQTITTALRENRWNTHVLSENLELDGDPIWISIRFEVDTARQTIGCDAGPRVRGGDHMFNPAEGGWVTYQGVTGESINWNIRGDLVPL